MGPGREPTLLTGYRFLDLTAADTECPTGMRNPSHCTNHKLSTIERTGISMTLRSIFIENWTPWSDSWRVRVMELNSKSMFDVQGMM